MHQTTPAKFMFRRIACMHACMHCMVDISPDKNHLTPSAFFFFFFFRSFLATTNPVLPPHFSPSLPLFPPPSLRRYLGTYSPVYPITMFPAMMSGLAAAKGHQKQGAISSASLPAYRAWHLLVSKPCMRKGPKRKPSTPTLHRDAHVTYVLHPVQVMANKRLVADNAGLGALPKTKVDTTR